MKSMEPSLNVTDYLAPFLFVSFMCGLKVWLSHLDIFCPFSMEVSPSALSVASNINVSEQVYDTMGNRILDFLFLQLGQNEILVIYALCRTFLSRLSTGIINYFIVLVEPGVLLQWISEICISNVLITLNGLSLLSWLVSFINLFWFPDSFLTFEDLVCLPFSCYWECKV